MKQIHITLTLPLLVFLAYFCCTASAKLMWRMKPGEIIALRGNLVMLNCFVEGRNITNPGEHRFWWYRVDRNVVLSKNLQITATDPDSDRYSVLLDKYRGVYSLVIRNVSEADGGLYQCLLKQSRNGPQEASDNASLTVLTPPTHGYKACTMFTQSNIILSPRENRALKCPKSTDAFWRSVSSNIATNETVYHSWTAGNRQVLHAFFLQNKTTLLSESSATGNQETVYCAVNSSMLQQFPNRCMLIPRGTTTEAVITPPIIDIPNGESVNFTCSHEDVAVAIDYTWVLPVELEVGGIQFINSGRTIILKGIQGNWGEMLNIVCQVTTEWGVKANATATIAFLHKMITTPIVNAIAKEEKVEKPQVIKPRPVIPDESQRPSKSANPALKNISILIGPALGVIILFLLAVIFALCVTKRKTSAKHRPRVSTQLSYSTDPQKSVTLRSVNKASNRNSRSSRRFSDSFTYRFSRDCEYENIEAYMAKKGQFLGGTTSFQDENNQPMEANVRVKIEMPNSLSTSMPALNHCKISSNIHNHDANQPQHYNNHHPHMTHHQPYKPLANGNPYATREQLGFPSLISQELRETEHYHVPTTTSSTMPHAVIDRSKKAMKPPNPPPRKPSY